MDLTGMGIALLPYLKVGKGDKWILYENTWPDI